jgi:hypothetical protein
MTATNLTPFEAARDAVIDRVTAVTAEPSAPARIGTALHATVYEIEEALDRLPRVSLPSVLREALVKVLQEGSDAYWTAARPSHGAKVTPTDEAVLALARKINEVTAPRLDMLAAIAAARGANS